MSRASSTAIALALVLITEPLAGADQLRPRPDPKSGVSLYRAHCASCHGPSGKGDGPVVPTLLVTPPDLTLLAARNGGVYPAREVALAIDGRQSASTHRLRDMPKWGAVMNTLEAGDQRAVDARLAALVSYLETLQSAAK